MSDASESAVAEGMTEAQTRELLSSILGATPLAIYAKDTDHRFVFSNRMHLQLLGLPPDQVLRHTDTDLFGDEAAPVEEVTRRVLDTGRPIAKEFELTLGGEPHTFLETIYPLQTAGELRGVAGIATDITARRRLEDALRSKNTELEEALDTLERTQDILIEQRKLAGLAELSTGVAHEVNTPLHVGIMGSTYILDVIRELEEASHSDTLTPATLAQLTEQLKESATLICGSLQRAAELIQSIKQVAADRQGQTLRRVQLGDWLERFVRTLEPLARRAGAEIRTEALHNPAVMLATGQLEQIITNLVINALDHAFTGDCADPCVTIQLDQVGEALQVRVDDNGVGISEEARTRIFEPFFTTRRGTGGTGLGLHIAWSLTTGIFEGELMLRDKEGPGSRFQLTLPVGTASLDWAPT